MTDNTAKDDKGNDKIIHNKKKSHPE